MSPLRSLLFVAIASCSKPSAAPAASVASQSAPAQAASAPASPPASAPPPEAFAKWTTTDVVAVFRRIYPSQVTGYRPMTVKDYGAAPMSATDGVKYVVPALGGDNGGRILVFDNEADLKKTRAYYDDLRKSSAWLFSWTFVKDNVLLQINGKMDADSAKNLGQALSMLGQDVSTLPQAVDPDSPPPRRKAAPAPSVADEHAAPAMPSAHPSDPYGQ